MELKTIHGWRFLESAFSLALLSFSVCLFLPLALCHLCEVCVSPSLPPPLSPSTQGFGQEPATSLRQIFPGSPKAILPGFPLDLYPLPMFQVIYRRIYLFYVVMNSFAKPILNETLLLTCMNESFTVFCLFGLIFICHCLWICPKSFPQYALRHSAILHNAEVVEHCVSAAGKTRMMQLCCHFRLTNRPSERGREWNGIADKLLWPLGSFGLQSARHIQCLPQVSSSMNMLLPHGEKAYCAHRTESSTPIIGQIIFSQLDA